MAARGKSQPINLANCVEHKVRLQVQMSENLVVEGNIAGFDEFMNLVLENAEECFVQSNTRSSLGTVILKGDHIKSIQKVEGDSSASTSASSSTQQD